jgi:hypothetical protein
LEQNVNIAVNTAWVVEIDVPGTFKDREGHDIEAIASRSKGIVDQGCRIHKNVQRTTCIQREGRVDANRGLIGTGPVEIGRGK